jgi:hypothetical protein
LIFKTIFEEINAKADLENKINSNIDHRQSPVFLLYFKVSPRGLICYVFLRKFVAEVVMSDENDEVLGVAGLETSI